ncbi:metallopeptidase TldD-related protein [Streptacidiphilus sp. EB103A]|uniref:metallopeptidase TldD-related protein n=1 Tax=Streptacidiphilus sp. EB103A TaxID=3156275 RepID=UPI0035151DEE
MTPHPDEIAQRRVRVSGSASEPVITERATGCCVDARLLESARLREAALELHRTALEIARGAGAGESRVIVRVGSRWVSRTADGHELVQRSRLESLVQVQVAASGRTVPLLWQWAGPRPVGALRSTAAQVAGEIRAASVAVPLEEAFAGAMVLAPELAVHFAHETVGHSLEADNYRDYASSSGMALGNRISAEAFTVLDGPPAEGLETSYWTDDEGFPAERTPLVDAGVVAGVMTDAAEASRQQLPRTGNGRRSFGARQAQPRMSALRVARGTTRSEDLVPSVRRGLYCRGAWGGGSVEELFVLRPAYAEWIEDGELTGMLVSRLDIKGYKTSALRALCQVGDDMGVFNPVNGCGKNGQELPVSMESPSLAFDRLTVVPLPDTSGGVVG